VAGTYGVHYGHLIGNTMPINNDAKLGETQALPLLASLAVDLQPGALAGALSQAGGPFPVAGDYGRFILRDVVTGDRVEIGESTAGAYDEVLLKGSYDILYDHVLGGAVVANVGANLGCVVFEPPAPDPGFGIVIR